MSILTAAKPLAITMWDFSWLERRWTGGGYEDWDRALDELADRGYDAVRIDAYPHFFADDSRTEKTVLPPWNQNDWGSPAKVSVSIQPSLNEFIGKCRDRNIQVALSSWYQNDLKGLRNHIPTPTALGRLWLKVLDEIAEAGLLESILFVDLCNEWPDATWAPFYFGEGRYDADWSTPESLRWMTHSIAILRESYPDLAYTFSFASHLFDKQQTDLKMLDFLEPHTWMTRDSEFYRRIGYDYPKFDPSGYEILVDNAEALYRSDETYWQGILVDNIQNLANWSLQSDLPLVTTECWGIVDFKDWPGLNWQWVKDLAEIGVRTASETGRWRAIATTNFCGPQFRGMWEDTSWHRRMTQLIKGGDIHA